MPTHIRTFSVVTWCLARSYPAGESALSAVYGGTEPLQVAPGRPKAHYPLVAVVETTDTPEAATDVVSADRIAVRDRDGSE